MRKSTSASRSLRHITISSALDDDAAYDALRSRYSLEHTASVRDYVQIFAPTYAQAWQMLFEQWSPPQQQSRIEAVKELETRRSFPTPEN